MNNSPLEKVMATLRDIAIDIEITANWINDPTYGGTRKTKKQLCSSAKKINDCFERLKKLTGADPCK